MKNLSSFCCCFLFATALLSQGKEDYIWTVGLNTPDTSLSGLCFMDFKNGEPQVQRFTNKNSLGSTSTISDDDGNLLFYAGGCGFYNRNKELMFNADTFYAGDAYDYYCQDSLRSFSTLPLILTLPWPHKKGKYKTFIVRYNSPLSTKYMEELISADVDMALDGGLGGWKT